MQNQIQAILWDNDGVLVDTEHIYFEVTRIVLAEAGVELDLSRYRELFLKACSGAWHLVAEAGYSPDEVETFRTRRNDLYARTLQTAELTVPGAEEVLQSLAGRVRMAVVTSSRRIPFEVIHERTGFLKYFEFALVREDYSKSKPHPEPYLAAVTRIGVPKENCLVVEDSERGLRAAAAAGLRCWVIPNRLSSDGEFSRAERILESIRQIPDLLLDTPKTPG
jgi:HAD superfamily hydrolase (TIGR01509 family)